MKGAWVLPGLVFGSLMGSAQNLAPALQSMVDAERLFAARSANTSTRAAFLENMDDSTVLSVSGSLVKGRPTWQERSPDSTKLFWWPVFAGVSAAGDLGFSMGPWEWSADRKGSAPSAFGYYCTMWKHVRGTWKMAIDMGISVPSSASADSILHTVPPGALNKTSFSMAELLVMDRAYTDSLAARSYVPGRLAPDARILRPGQFPADTGNALLLKDAGILRFDQQGGDLSASADLGYTYGYVTTADDPSVTHTYLHVWRRQAGGWKLILDVIKA